ncbi:hypothetical protein [Dactylosporangium salmoneum]|uniref:hypothetical protein n=1 Tax=Dactylosporangium salmoneum TaxID=53361 RepID=UPI0031CF2D25
MPESEDRVAQLEAQVAELERRLAWFTANAGAPRFTPGFNQVYRADGYGYVSVYYVGGATSRVRMFVGPQHPPTQCVGEANSGGRVDSHIGGVVRPGEYWVLECTKPNGEGYRAVFTPLF